MALLGAIGDTQKPRYHLAVLAGGGHYLRLALVRVRLPAGPQVNSSKFTRPLLFFKAPREAQTGVPLRFSAHPSQSQLSIRRPWTRANSPRFRVASAARE